jgi:O-antigen/teichoic acid export membrane protein
MYSREQFRRTFGDIVQETIDSLREIRQGRNATAALPMYLNSAALILTVVASAALGQLSWLVAARLFSPSEVGQASAVITGTLLCGQIALLGFGSAMINLLPEYRRQPSDFLRTTFSTVAIAGLVAGGVYLLVAATGLHQLRSLATDPWQASIVLVTAGLMPVALLIDQTSIALRRGDSVLMRALAGGGVRLGCVLVFGILTVSHPLHSVAILVAWLSAALTPCILGYAQLRQALPGFRFRPTIKPAIVRSSLALGLPHHALSLALLGPGLVIPSLVAELLSPAATAYWYVAWMLAGVAFVIPSSIGTALFAEAANQSQALQRGIGHGVRASLALGLLAALGLGLAGGWLLQLLGATYRSEASTPLRILLLGVLPLAFVETYVASCRARRKLFEPAVTCLAGGLLATAGVALTAPHYGLNGAAAAWLAAQLLTGGWSALRLRTIVASRSPSQREREPSQI